MSDKAVRLSAAAGGVSIASEKEEAPAVLTPGCGSNRLFSDPRPLSDSGAVGGPESVGKADPGFASDAEKSRAGRAIVFSGKLRVLLEAYQVVHAIPGRLRLRPLPGKASFARAGEAQLADLLARAYSRAEIRLSRRTGSILIISQGLVLAGADKSGHGAVVVTDHAASSHPVEVRNPIPGKVRSFFYPRLFNYVIAGFRSIPYVIQALGQLIRGRLNLDVLDGAALVVCLLQRDFRSLSSITFFFALGEYLADWTKKKSRASLEETLALNIEQVWIRADGTECLVPFADLKKGDQVVVRAGSAIPVDGCVVEGTGMVNQASMTGEPLAVPRAEGATVYAGTVLEDGEIVIEATRVGSATRINAILRTIEESESAKASVQGRYEHIADAIVPYNFLLSGAVYAATRSPMRAGSVLLVDYSCAIRLAAPLCIFTAMQEAASHGVLIKGGKFMEAIAEADVLVFDKTGTLTSACPHLVGVVPFGGRKRATILRLAACLEEYFAHPVGQAVVRASDEEGLKHREEHTKVEFVVAHGIASSWRGQRVLIGSDHFVLEDEGVPISEKQLQIATEEGRKGRSVLYLSIGGELAGFLLIEDSIRPDAKQVLQRLRDDGVRRIVMLTGDGEETAASIAALAGVDEYRARLLPEDKAAFIRSLKAAGHKVAMVGDGINDSPALSEAHVGIAMAEGADMAREVADIVMHRGLDGLLVTRRISRAALGRIHSNFRTSLFWNSAFLMGGLMGLLMPGVSAFLHNATTAAIAVSSVRPYLPLEERGATPHKGLLEWRGPGDIEGKR